VADSFSHPTGKFDVGIAPRASHRNSPLSRIRWLRSTAVPSVNSQRLFSATTLCKPSSCKFALALQRTIKGTYTNPRPPVNPHPWWFPGSLQVRLIQTAHWVFQQLLPTDPPRKADIARKKGSSWNRVGGNGDRDSVSPCLDR
jgi:hypothetical protein